MSERDIVAAVVEYYEGKLAAFGPSARGVDWKDESSQAKRFEQLLRALGLDPAHEPFTLLDFGCGYGALRSFLAERGYRCAYTGYDRSEQMIAAARGLHEDAAFTTDWASAPPADYVVASGIFNVRLDTPDDVWRDYIVGTLAALNEKASAGWAANFLTGYADEDRKRPDLYYSSPAFVFDWCKRHASRAVCLLHDYDLYEFTVGVLRRPR